MGAGVLSSKGSAALVTGLLFEPGQNVLDIESAFDLATDVVGLRSPQRIEQSPRQKKHRCEQELGAFSAGATIRWGFV